MPKMVHGSDADAGGPDIFEARVVLVTGVAGFLGSHFARKLLRDSSLKLVVGVDKMSSTSSVRSVCELEQDDRFIFVKGNILSEGFLSLIYEKYNIDTVVHFAAQTVVENEGNSLDFTLNIVVGTHFLLESMRLYGGIRRFIYASTDEVYGEKRTVSETAQEEEVKYEPPNPYAAAKAAAEMMAKAYTTSYGLSTIIVRVCNVYGPGEFPNKVIPKFTLLALDGKPLPVQGTGSAVRCFIYVEDVVEAFYTILSKGKDNETYTVGPEGQKLVMDVARDILSTVGMDGQDANILFVPKRSFIDERHFIVDHELRKLGWSEKVSWDEGLKATVDWYQEHGKCWWECIDLSGENPGASSPLGK